MLGNLGMCGVPFKNVIPNFFYNVKLVVNAINKHQCTYLIGTPTMIIDILDYLETNNIKLDSLKGINTGGSSMPINVAHRVHKIIPTCTDVRVAYGATEAGELLSRGHNQMIGYWRDEKNTRAAIDSSNWYKSGDLATMDEHGYIKIVGRTKEMIIRGGENIYPREVEELLHKHPDILDAYVCGVPDHRTGEEVCAWIQPKDPNRKPTEAEIREFCKQRITYFKVPRYVLFVDKFPLTPAGKVKKFVMREQSCRILGLNDK
ncbi:unnamed protein product [Oppiella nova]|uniref:Medium-chain acyl-CoA ligase ACSF2, mitochondrial n=1 Tax=Oppiella nova TaxID=334625 RepID=A0A7R9LQ46_9ACAR|nr:unnamed protein product [Oppiella nova]CAG2165243.1 unnamed protein product [Oppiella nova]